MIPELDVGKRAIPVQEHENGAYRGFGVRGGVDMHAHWEMTADSVDDFGTRPGDGVCGH